MSNENHRYDTPPGIEPSHPEPDATVPDPDALLSALADPTRRRLVWYLVDRDESGTAVEEVTDVLLGWRATDSDVVGADERERVYLALEHVHLPKLADCDLIDYDPNADRVRLEPLAPAVVDIVRSTYRYERLASTGER